MTSSAGGITIASPGPMIALASLMKSQTHFVREDEAGLLVAVARVVDA